MAPLRRPAGGRIFFPWERRGGLLRRLGLDRVRPFLLGMLGLGFVVLIGVREHRRAGERQTRAILYVMRGAVDRWMADHEGACPGSLGAVVEGSSLKAAPRDAWGRPFRLACPSGREGSRYDLTSDGADGLPGGLDRIE